MSSKDHKGAIAAYEAAVALDVNDAERTASYKLGVTSARDAMSAAVEEARGHLTGGQSAVSEYDWESAIESFTAGLAVQGTHDADLTSSLQESLESAQASMSARDAARGTAEQHKRPATHSCSQELPTCCCHPPHSFLPRLPSAGSEETALDSPSESAPAR